MATGIEGREDSRGTEVLHSSKGTRASPVGKTDWSLVTDRVERGEVLRRRGLSSSIADGDGPQIRTELT